MIGANSKTLRGKAIQGLAFESCQIAIRLTITVAKLAILARMLSPEAFGILGLALALLMGFQTLTQLGSDRYLIQKQHIEARLIGTAWLFNVLRGALVCMVSLAMAPLYVRIMGVPDSLNILNIVAFTALVRGFKSPGSFLAERDIRYLIVGSYEILMTAFDAIIAVVLVHYVGGVAGLAWGLMLSSIAEVILSYSFFGFGCRLVVNWGALRELLGVGKHFVIIAIGSYIMIQGDNLVIGALLGSTLLGYYLVAYKLVDLPINLVLQITNRVALSALSRIQHDPVRMRRAFLELFDLQSSLLFPAICGVVFLAEPLVLSLFGPKWQASVPVVRALGLIMLGRGFSNMVVPFLIASGDFSFASKVKSVETLIFIAGVLVGSLTAGVVGAALGGGCGYLSAGVMRLWYLVHVGGIRGRILFEHFRPVIAATIFPTLIALALSMFLAIPPVLRLALSGVSFALSYALTTSLLRPDFTRQVRQNMRHLFVVRVPDSIAHRA